MPDRFAAPASAADTLLPALRVEIVRLLAGALGAMDPQIPAAAEEAAGVVTLR